jgi:3-oxoacyl-[acyl-carrier protein] reductase
LFVDRSKFHIAEISQAVLALDGEAIKPFNRPHRDLLQKRGSAMDLKLRDKVAIVGGSSQGIGLGIARALAAEGVKLALTARREAILRDACDQIESETGVKPLALVADSRRPEDCTSVVAATAAHFGGLDIVVNNDGAPPLGELISFDDAAWQQAIERNLMYVVRMCREAVPRIQSRGGGSILNITALSAIQPIVGFGLSVATWDAVIGYAKTLSLEVARSSINVNTICPGYIETGRLQKAFAGADEDEQPMREMLTNEVPMRRIGTVEDIANLVAFLVSPRGSYITGTAIQVDGGLLRGLR